MYMHIFSVLSCIADDLGHDVWIRHACGMFF